MQTALRWAAVLPAAAGAFVVLIFGAWWASRPIVESSPFNQAFAMILGWVSAGGVATYVGAEVAPSYKRTVATILAAMHASLMLTLFFVENMNFVDNARVLGSAVGAIGGAASVYYAAAHPDEDDELV